MYFNTVYIEDMEIGDYLLFALFLQPKFTSRLRSETAPSRPTSSSRSGRKKEQPVPEFMKEFQSKKKSTTST